MHTAKPVPPMRHAPDQGRQAGAVVDREADRARADEEARRSLRERRGVPRARSRTRCDRRTAASPTSASSAPATPAASRSCRTRAGRDRRGGRGRHRRDDGRAGADERLIGDAIDEVLARAPKPRRRRARCRARRRRRGAASRRGRAAEARVAPGRGTLPPPATLARSSRQSPRRRADAPPLRARRRRRVASGSGCRSPGRRRADLRSAHAGAAPRRAARRIDRAARRPPTPPPPGRGDAAAGARADTAAADRGSPDERAATGVRRAARRAGHRAAARARWPLYAGDRRRRRDRRHHHRDRDVASRGADGPTRPRASPSRARGGRRARRTATRRDAIRVLDKNRPRRRTTASRSSCSAALAAARRRERVARRGRRPPRALRADRRSRPTRSCARTCARWPRARTRRSSPTRSTCGSRPTIPTRSRDRRSASRASASDLDAGMPCAGDRSRQARRLGRLARAYELDLEEGDTCAKRKAAVARAARARRSDGGPSLERAVAKTEAQPAACSTTRRRDRLPQDDAQDDVRARAARCAALGRGARHRRGSATAGSAPVGGGFALGHDGAKLIVLAGEADPPTPRGSAAPDPRTTRSSFPRELRSRSRASAGAASARSSTRCPIPTALPDLEGAAPLARRVARARAAAARRRARVGRARGTIWSAWVDGVPVDVRVRAVAQRALVRRLASTRSPPARQLGLGTLVAAAMIRDERARGREPVWGADEGNIASLRAREAARLRADRRALGRGAVA